MNLNFSERLEIGDLVELSGIAHFTLRPSYLKIIRPCFPAKIVKVNILDEFQVAGVYDGFPNLFWFHPGELQKVEEVEETIP